MGLDFKPTIHNYMEFAGKAISDGKYMLCVHNISDALKTAETPEDRGAIWKCFSDMYNGCDNRNISECALFRACCELYKGGFYALDFGNLFPKLEYLREDDEIEADSDTVLIYNGTYNLLINGEIKAALELFNDLPIYSLGLDRIFNKMEEIILGGKQIILDNNFVKLIFILKSDYIKPKSFVRVMIRGGELTKQVMAETISDFIDDIADRSLLDDYGEVLLEEGESALAQICFEKSLSYCDIDEKALYYMAYIMHKKGNEKESERYLSQYKVCYERFGAPVEILDKSFNLENMPAFGETDSEIIYEATNAVLNGNNTERYLSDLKTVLSYGEEKNVKHVINSVDIEDNNILHILKELMISAYVTDDRKKFLLTELLDKGYEGSVAIKFLNKGVIADLIKFNLRGAKGFWNRVFRKVTVAILAFENEIIHYNANVLALMIKNFAKSCAKAKITPVENDFEFIVYITAMQYCHYRKETDNIKMCKIVPEISSEQLMEGLDKFRPEEVSF